ncbi:sugar porter family MFS transporter [Acidisoma cellulosilytica]|uniref:Sugar porter family MFS transporter n=2 Tax=Acidisoma cellulosilyticum TaxID=2802395 RepID=A0A963Z653_9PROT|nr:sugar porter family MFS transporter [Acidisoma cellulosilyticum]
MSVATSPAMAAKAGGGDHSFFTAGMAALAGLMFGLDIGVISGALDFIGKAFGADDSAKEWIVSSMMFGAAVGALAAGVLSFRLGRKVSLILGAILFVIGSLFCAAAWSVESLIIARVVLGLAIGIATFTAPLYISEIAPPEKRGSMISTYQLMITIGILAAFVSDTLFSYSGAWRWMLGIVAVPGALFLIGVTRLPNSPRWLLMRGKNREAREVLNQLRGSQAVVDAEYRDIEEQLRRPQAGWSLFQQNPNFRRSVFLGVVLQVVQQFTGMNVVMYYAPRIFQAAGFQGHMALWGTAIVGLVNVLATFIAIGFVDRWGRRPVLLTGFVVMFVGMGVLGYMLHIGTTTLPAQIFAVVMLLIFITGFAMSAGPLIWVLCSEVQPTKGRDFGIAASTLTNWVANFIVGITFLTMLNSFGSGLTFGIYAALNLLFFFFTIFFVPETKGVTLEHIEANLMAGKPLRNIGA